MKFLTDEGIKLVEYKSGLDESSVEESIRQINKRKQVDTDRDYLDWYKSENYSVLFITPDERFEKFRPVFTANNIRLIILDSDKLEYKLNEIGLGGFWNEIRGEK